MTEALIAYYRNLMNTGFAYAGMVENPSITMENFGEVSPVCGNPDDYMMVYARINEDVIDDIKYSCISDPTNNVALEMLCILMKGKTLDEATGMKEDAFCQLLGADDPLLREKGGVLLKELSNKIVEYKTR